MNQEPYVFPHMNIVIVPNVAQINISVALGSKLQRDQDVPNNMVKGLAAGESTQGGSSMQSSVVFKRPGEVTSVPAGADFLGKTEVDHAPILT